MTIDQIKKQMDAKEVFQWMAYELSIDPERNKKFKEQIALENSAKLTDEQRAQLIKEQLNFACSKG